MPESDQIKIFIAYSRKDVDYLDQLRTHLIPLTLKDNVTIWYDGKIDPGSEWDKEIKNQIHSADIILLMISADSIASHYFYDTEVADALHRHAEGRAIVVPFIVRPCGWEMTPLGSLQAIPKDGKAVVNWPVPDDAYHDAFTSLWKIVTGIEEGKRLAELQKVEERERAIQEREQKRLAEGRKREEALAAEDQQAWEIALRVNTTTAFRDYISKYPDGNYLDLARRKINALQKEEVKASSGSNRDKGESVESKQKVAEWFMNVETFGAGQIMVVSLLLSLGTTFLLLLYASLPALGDIGFPYVYMLYMTLAIFLLAWGVLWVYPHIQRRIVTPMSSTSKRRFAAEHLWVSLLLAVVGTIVFYFIYWQRFFLGHLPVILLHIVVNFLFCTWVFTILARWTVKAGLGNLTAINSMIKKSLFLLFGVYTLSVLLDFVVRLIIGDVQLDDIAPFLYHISANSFVFVPVVPIISHLVNCVLTKRSLQNAVE